MSNFKREAEELIEKIIAEWLMFDSPYTDKFSVILWATLAIDDLVDRYARDSKERNLLLDKFWEIFKKKIEERKE